MDRINENIIYKDLSSGDLKVFIDKNKDFYFFPYVIATGATSIKDILTFNTLIRERIFTGTRTILVKPLGWESPLDPIDENNKIIDLNNLLDISNEEPVKPENYDNLEENDYQKINYNNNLKRYQLYLNTATKTKNCRGKKQFKPGAYIVGKILPPLNYENNFTEDDDGYVRQIVTSTIKVRFDINQKDAGNLKDFIWNKESGTINKDYMSLLWLVPEINGNDLLYIVDIQVFVHPKKNNYLFHQITFKSVKEQLRKVGKAIRQMIQFGQPGETFFKPNVISTSFKIKIKTNNDGKVIYDSDGKAETIEIPQTKRLPTIDDINNDIENIKNDINYSPLFFVKNKGINSIQMEVDGVSGLLAFDVYGHLKDKDPSIVNIITPLWIEKFLSPIISPLSKNYHYEHNHLIIPDSSFGLINYAKNWQLDRGIVFDPNKFRENKGSILIPSIEQTIKPNKGWPYYIKKGDFTNESIPETNSYYIDGKKIDILTVAQFINCINFRKTENENFSYSMDSNNNISNLRFNGKDSIDDSWNISESLYLSSQFSLKFDKSIDNEDVDNENVGKIWNNSINKDHIRENSSGPLWIYENATKADVLNYMNYINKKLIVLEPYKVKWEDYRGRIKAISRLLASVISFAFLFVPARIIPNLVKIIGTSIFQQTVPQIFNFIPAEWYTYRILISSGISHEFPFLLSRTALNMWLANVPRTLDGIPITTFTTFDNFVSSVIDSSQFRDVFNFKLTNKVQTFDETKIDQKDTFKLDEVVRGNKKIKLGNYKTTITLPKDKEDEFVIDSIVLKIIGKRNIKLTFFDIDDNVVNYHEFEAQAKWSGNMKEVTNVLIFNYLGDNYTSFDEYKKNSILEPQTEPILNLKTVNTIENKIQIYDDIILKIQNNFSTIKKEINNSVESIEILNIIKKINTLSIFNITKKDIITSDIKIVKKDITSNLKEELIKLANEKLLILYQKIQINLISKIKDNYKESDFLKTIKIEIDSYDFPENIKQNINLIYSKYLNLYNIEFKLITFTNVSSSEELIYNLNISRSIENLQTLRKILLQNNVISNEDKNQFKKKIKLSIESKSNLYKYRILESIKKINIEKPLDFVNFANILKNAKIFYLGNDYDANSFPTQPNPMDLIDINQWNENTTESQLKKLKIAEIYDNLNEIKEACINTFLNKYSEIIKNTIEIQLKKLKLVKKSNILDDIETKIFNIIKSKKLGESSENIQTIINNINDEINDDIENLIATIDDDIDTANVYISGFDTNVKTQETSFAEYVYIKDIVMRGHVITYSDKEKREDIQNLITKYIELEIDSSLTSINKNMLETLKNIYNTTEYIAPNEILEQTIKAKKIIGTNVWNHPYYAPFDYEYSDDPMTTEVDYSQTENNWNSYLWYIKEEIKSKNTTLRKHNKSSDKFLDMKSGEKIVFMNLEGKKSSEEIYENYRNIYTELYEKIYYQTVTFSGLKNESFGLASPLEYFNRRIKQYNPRISFYVNYNNNFKYLDWTKINCSLKFAWKDTSNISSDANYRFFDFDKNEILSPKFSKKLNLDDKIILSRSKWSIISSKIYKFDKNWQYVKINDSNFVPSTQFLPYLSINENRITMGFDKMRIYMKIPNSRISGHGRTGDWIKLPNIWVTEPAIYFTKFHLFREITPSNIIEDINNLHISSLKLSETELLESTILKKIFISIDKNDWINHTLSRILKPEYQQIIKFILLSPYFKLLRSYLSKYQVILL